MTLDQWLQQSGKSVEHFSLELGVRRQTVHRYISGDRFPRPEIINRVADLTDGQVQAADWYSEKPSEPALRTSAHP